MAKSILISGASSGIGLATAIFLAEHGYQVYAGARHLENAADLQRAATRHDNISIVQLEMTSQEQINAACNKIQQQTQRLDAVLANAGFGIYGPPEAVSCDELHRMFDVNVMGVKRLMDAALPIMRETVAEQGEARFCSLSSIGHLPDQCVGAYSVTKCAQESLMANQARYDEHIHFISIQPGPVLTNFLSKTQFGSRSESLPYYNVMQAEFPKWQEIMKHGQEPSLIAGLIHHALETPNPKAWYQTSKLVSTAMSNIYKDISGDSYLTNNNPITVEEILRLAHEPAQ